MDGKGSLPSNNSFKVTPGGAPQLNRKTPMTKPELWIVLVVALGALLAIFWRQASALPKGQRLGMWLRNGSFIVSVLIVSWPLQVLRPRLGPFGYPASAFVVLLGGYLLGLLLARMASRPAQP